MKTVRQLLDENRSHHIRHTKVGDWLHVGWEGSRNKRLERIKHITPTGRRRTEWHEFDPHTGFARGKDGQKVYAKKASHQVLTQDFEHHARKAIANNLDQHGYDSLKHIMKHMRISMYDPHEDKYTET